jgi:hypothetical protein
MVTALGAGFDRLRELVSVQGTIALAFSGAFIVGFFMNKVSEDAFLGMAGLVIGFWFRGKENGRQNIPEEVKK